MTPCRTALFRDSCNVFRVSAYTFTTFGWILPRPDHGGWKDSGSFSTHANVESKKPRRLTEASNSSLPLQRMQLPPLEKNLVHFRQIVNTLLLKCRHPWQTCSYRVTACNCASANPSSAWHLLIRASYMGLKLRRHVVSGISPTNSSRAAQASDDGSREYPRPEHFPQVL